ncbi:MAG: transcriptional regulator [Candidatus Aureabacteria bacterium]|nr:transcriptional regulator [Candidatus Auribacterota bacterium]
MSDTPAAPKCPECGIQGIENIVSHDSAETSKGGDPWFNVASCGKCGHIYGVFAKRVVTPHVTIPPHIPSDFPR